MLLSVTELIGRLHPALVHLPIGILLIALLLQWLSQKPQYAIAHGVLKMLWAFGAASALLSCITGYILSVHDQYNDAAVALHMWSGIGVAAVSLLLFAKVSARQYDVLYKGGAVVLLLFIVAAGHLGGSLTHGSDYFLSALQNKSSSGDSVVIKPIADVQQAQVYNDIVKPILQTRCYSCHGENKQKAKLRLDDSTNILKGSEDGVVLKPGDAAHSDLVKSLLLPREDKKHMPPKEKAQLTPNQIALIQWWIDQGAPFTRTVATLTQPDAIKPALLSLQHEEMKKLPDTQVPTEPVTAADTSAIQALKRRGVVILPIAQGSNYLSANFSLAAQVHDSDLQLLQPLQKQLVWVKLGETGVTDGGLATLARCTQLRALWLNHTLVTDSGMKTLASLKNLSLLNLVGTQVTEAGVLQLKGLPQLKTIYLFQSKVAASHFTDLQTQFPHTQLDTGGYQVPTLATDTTEVKSKGLY